MTKAEIQAEQRVHLRARLLAWKQNATKVTENVAAASPPPRRIETTVPRDQTRGSPTQSYRPRDYRRTNALRSRLPDIYAFHVSQTVLAKELDLCINTVRDAIDRDAKSGNPQAQEYVRLRREDRKTMLSRSIVAHHMSKPGGDLREEIMKAVIEEAFTLKKNFNSIATDLGVAPSRVYTISKYLVRNKHPAAMEYVRVREQPGAHRAIKQRERPQDVKVAPSKPSPVPAPRSPAAPRIPLKFKYSLCPSPTNPTPKTKTVNAPTPPESPSKPTSAPQKPTPTVTRKRPYPTFS